MFGCSFSLERTFGEEAEKGKIETVNCGVGSLSYMRDEARKCAERMDRKNCAWAAWGEQLSS